MAFFLRSTLTCPCTKPFYMYTCFEQWTTIMCHPRLFLKDKLYVEMMLLAPFQYARLEVLLFACNGIKVKMATQYSTFDEALTIGISSI